MTLSFSPFLSDQENPKRFAAAAPITDTPVVDEPPSQEVDPAAKSPKASKKPMKKVVAVRNSKRLKKLSDVGATLEAHQTQAPPMMCMNILVYLLPLLRVDTHVLFSGQNLMKKFVALGNECVEYLKAAKASEGKFLFLYLLVLYAFLCFFA
jgi:hypothetical protein